MFSSKKENIDQLNIKNNQTIGTEKPKTHYKGVEGQKDRSSKSKKLNDQKDKQFKKDKFVGLDRPVLTDYKNWLELKKSDRYDVQSPKGTVMIKQEKAEKWKGKDK